MKNLFLLLSILILVSCNSNTTDKNINSQDHQKTLSQKIQNKKAVEFYDMGVKFIELRNLDSAKIFLKKSLQIEKNSITLNELGTIALSEKNYKEALNYFNLSIEKDSSYWPSHINKSRTFILADHLASAEETLKKMLVKCKSNYWTAYANFCLTYVYTHGILDCEKAKESVKNADLFLNSDSELKNQFGDLVRKMEEKCN